jgi:hypothetical protein
VKEAGRRSFLQSAAVAVLAACAGKRGLRIATFSADVTPPLGHGLLAGVIEPAREILDPLSANGLVLWPADESALVIVGVDWAEIRNDAHDRWREALAEAAGTIPERVLVSSLHQHDTPVMDLEAQRLLDSVGLPKRLCDAEFHEQAVQRVAQALREGCARPRPLTHIGMGEAPVENVASNRRIEDADGMVSYNRSAIVKDPAVQALPAGLIDPMLKTVSFWDGEAPVAALSCFSVHPITDYGKGMVSSDYVGLARRRRLEDDPSVAQVYLTGCAGDVVAGKYTDGDLALRPVLADRVYQAMRAAWDATERQSLERIGFRDVELDLPLRTAPGFTRQDQEAELNDATLDTTTRSLAAMGVSWWRRADAGHKLDIPVVDLGPVRILLLPGETFVQYQLWAQEMRPDLFVVAVGYGDCAPGYGPTLKAAEEGFDRRRRSAKTWMWADPDLAEAPMRAAIAQAMTD